MPAALKSAGSRRREQLLICACPNRKKHGKQKGEGKKRGSGKFSIVF